MKVVENDLFKVLFDETERRPMTVTELTAEAKAVIEQTFSSVWVEGEVVNFVQASSGHWYFNLNDGTSQIKCVCWKGTNFKIRFRPQNGIEVRVRGKLTLYQARGDFQLQVESLEPSGEGALKAAFDQIKAKLDGEGLFAPELKRPMPFYPTRIGVVTTKTGAAFHDIMNVLTRRSRTVSVLLAHAQVQGEGSADSVRNAIERLNAYNDLATTKEKLGVLIVGRGGGSAEDLWAFNDESLARAIRASKIPVISAVGHEIDWTIADLIADARAATPSAAAEMVAGREADIIERLDSRSRQMRQRMEYDLMMARNSVEDLTSRLTDNVEARCRRLGDRIASAAYRFSPQAVAAKFAAQRSAVDLLAQRTSTAQSKYLTILEDRLARQAATLEAMSPLK
nr:exodeoxyribonuclease VII large subunit [Pyrinomonadaceae bacterium]